MVRSAPLEALVISAWVRGLSDRDIEALLGEALGPEAALSKSTACGLINAVNTSLAGSLRRRCLIHRCRNVLAKIPVEHHLRGLLALIMEAINDDVDAAEAEADAGSGAEVRLVGADAVWADLSGRRGGGGGGGSVGDHPVACGRSRRAIAALQASKPGRPRDSPARRPPRWPGCGPRSTGSRPR